MNNALLPPQFQSKDLDCEEEERERKEAGAEEENFDIAPPDDNPRVSVVNKSRKSLKMLKEEMDIKQGRAGSKEDHEDAEFELDLNYEEQTIVYQNMHPTMEPLVRVHIIYGSDETRGCGVQAQEEAYENKKQLEEMIDNFSDWCPSDIEEDLDMMPCESDSSQEVSFSVEQFSVILSFERTCSNQSICEI